MTSDEYKKIQGTWKDMRQRCYNANHFAYSYYGNIGIEVDKCWNTFAKFLGSMPPGWFAGATLDRKDFDGHYTPSNCRWIEKRFQTIVGKLRGRKDNTSGMVGIEIVRGMYRVLVRSTPERDGPKRTLYLGHDLFEAACRRKSWENQRREYWREQGSPE